MSKQAWTTDELLAELERYEREWLSGITDRSVR
jgi:hypothetical protein